MGRCLIIIGTKGQVTEAAISETTAKFLASYQKPKFVEFVDELPKTPAGKIDKRMLRLGNPPAIVNPREKN